VTSPTSPTSQDQPLTDQVAERELAVFIGPRWPAYRKKFAPFLTDPGFVPTWNWAAALVPFGAWFLYRKMVMPFFLFWLGPGLAQVLIQGKDAATATEPDPLAIGVMISMAITAGGTGNYLLYRRAQAARQLVAAQRLPPSEADTALARIGGVNRGAIWIAAVLMILSALARYMAGGAG
jgi:hypothetical protein